MCRTPSLDFDHRTPFSAKQRFTSEVDQDQYRCPQGMLLPRRKANSSERVITSPYTGFADKDRLDLTTK